MTDLVWSVRTAGAWRTRAPRPDEVRLWAVPLSSAQPDESKLCRLLSGGDLKRAGAYGSPARRRRFIIGRAVLRTILAGCLDVRPAEVPLVLGRRGKPELAAPDGPVQFNLSHCPGLVLVGIAAHPIGVDVEVVSASPDFDGVARRYFHPAERRALAELPPGEQRRRAFFRCWTRKEAVIKALGTGFAMPMSSFAVTVGQRPAPRLVGYDSRFPGQLPWHFAHLEPLPQIVGAVAVSGPITSVTGTVMRDSIV